MSRSALSTTAVGLRKARSAAGAIGMAILLMGCGQGAGTPTLEPSVQASVQATPVATATPEPSATQAAGPVTVTKNVAFESANEVMMPGSLDVYAPTRAGTWPVVVMFHGAGGHKQDLTAQALRVAELGFVAFVPDWGWVNPSASVDLLSAEGLVASDLQNACAVAFAAAQAPEYNGDPERLVLFGHSGGAMVAAGLAFKGGSIGPGCETDVPVPVADVLVEWEGDWLNYLMMGAWTDLFEADPAMVDSMMIWSALPERPELPVEMLIGQDSSAQIPEMELADLAVRDSHGSLRAQLEANGALDDGAISWAEEQQLLFSVLQAQGNPVHFAQMPGSTHTMLSQEGWGVFLDAFDSALTSMAD